MKPYPALSFLTLTRSLTPSVPPRLPLNTELQLLQSPLSTLSTHSHSHSHPQSPSSPFTIALPSTSPLKLALRSSVLTPHARRVAVTVALRSSWVLATAAAPYSRRRCWSRSWAPGSCPLALWPLGMLVGPLALWVSLSVFIAAAPRLLVLCSSPLSYQISD
ncbi:uncharacterized protein LOC130939224 [Arachis stenosperma]|uniref:uncharacterized protein LOC130939224 n=1 Tax=Arachis stenosperma TaxID=217475 RepID=UPI0025ACBB7B|nr:uncharacterized protein LOC130939224 [Arachis stenosperma]